MMTAEERYIAAEYTRQITRRAAAIFHQPWRLLRNRRLRREMRTLLANSETAFPPRPARRRRPGPVTVYREPPR